MEARRVGFSQESIRPGRRLEWPADASNEIDWVARLEKPNLEAVVIERTKRGAREALEYRRASVPPDLDLPKQSDEAKLEVSPVRCNAHGPLQQPRRTEPS